MKKKCEALFGVSNMKSIMQLDAGVGKMTKAAPVVFSKAVELFLQDLCDRTYDFTLKKGARAMTAHHLKECIQEHPMFDFLNDVVSHVPDEPQAASNTGRRRKPVQKDKDDSCKTKSSKRSRSDSSTNQGSGRRCGKGGKHEKIESEEPAKPNDNEASSSPQHNAVNSKPRGEAPELLLKPEDIIAVMRHSDKIFEPEEDYDCED